MAKKRRKKRIKWNRVCIAFLAVILILFGLYKGTSFIIHQVVSIFSNEEVGSSEVIPTEKPKSYKATIVVDPGHGGIDAGANIGKLYEKDITLKTAKYLQEELDKLDIKAILTRESDATLKSGKNDDLIARAAFSSQYKADYFVSIHVNGYEKSNDIYGFEVYTRNDESKSLANMILTQMDTLGYSKNRGLVDGKNLMVLKKNTVPAVLIEMGYIKSKDKVYLSDDTKLQSIAKVVAKGIDNQVEKSLKS